MELRYGASHTANTKHLRSHRTEVVALFVAVSIAAMYCYCLLSFAAVAVLPGAHGATSATPQALITTNTNLVPNGQGPVLYYNGTGPVPSYDEVSPDPTSITPTNR